MVASWYERHRCEWLYRPIHFYQLSINVPIINYLLTHKGEIPYPYVKLFICEIGNELLLMQDNATQSQCNSEY